MLLLLRRMRAGKRVRVLALDEMWTYAGVRRGEKRQSAWIWTAAWEEEDGSRRADFEVGDRSEAAFLRMYEGLPEARRYYSGGYEVYGWLPCGRHEAGKGGPVNWNGGLHSRLRSGLNRLVRDMKGYSKSPLMLAGSVALWLLRKGLI